MRILLLATFMLACRANAADLRLLDVARSTAAYGRVDDDLRGSRTRCDARPRPGPRPG